MLFELCERHKRADSQAAFAIRFDAIKPSYVLEIDDAHGACDVLFHGGQDVLPACNRSRRLVHVIRRGRRLQQLDCFVDGRWTDPLKSLHALLLSFINPIKILSGVMGSSRTRTPQALKTALTTAPSAGMIADSPTPMTCSRLSSSSINGTSSGISSEPGSL